jgi:hypothetical protein
MYEGNGDEMNGLVPEEEGALVSLAHGFFGLLARDPTEEPRLGAQLVDLKEVPASTSQPLR